MGVSLLFVWGSLKVECCLCISKSNLFVLSALGSEGEVLSGRCIVTVGLDVIVASVFLCESINKGQLFEKHTKRKRFKNRFLRNHICQEYSINHQSNVAAAKHLRC